jgi:hypothetical protein
MFRRHSRLNHLQTRKKLLLAESELHRAELVKEVQEVKDEISHIKDQIRAAGSIASSAALVATAVSMFRRRFTDSENSGGRRKSSWIATAIAGARLGTSLYSKLRTLFQDRK